MQAYRIVNWWKFEMLKNGKLATAKTKMAALRIRPLIYVRFPIHGHTLSAGYRRMVKRAGPDLAAACDGVYKMLVGLAGNQVREYRGWVLDDRQQPLKPGQVAELLCLSERKVHQIFEILTDRDVKWVVFLAFPETLHKSLNNSELAQKSQIKKFGNNREEKGSPLYEAETEKIKLNDSIRSESNRRGVVGEESGAGGFQETGVEGENAGQSQARPQAQASVSESDTDTVPASVSEGPTVSDSDSAPASDTAPPGPGAGPGTDGPGPLSEQKRFDILRERHKAGLEVMQILKINPRNNSDTTTISDIYEQLALRVLGGSPYTLFESSLNTARQCWRGDYPIAMFVAAMKQPPFYYVPKKLSVIPGKFSQGKNTNRNSQERRTQND